jgi:succinoglycan biosynthesis transport protein ExoP
MAENGSKLPAPSDPRLPGRFIVDDVRYGVMPGYPPEEEVGLDEIWSVLKRRKKWIAGAFLLVVGLAGAYSWLKTPVWQASTTLRVEEQDQGASSDPTQMLLLGLGQGGQVETEMRVAKTRPILARVVRDEELVFQVDRPAETPRSELFGAVVFDSTTPGATYTLDRQGSDRWRLQETTDRQPGDPPLLRPATFAAGEQIRVHGGTFTLLPDSLMDGRVPGASLPDRIDVHTTPFNRTVSDLSQIVDVSRPDPDANLIRIQYQGTDRLLVRDVPNDLAMAFVTRRQSVMKTEARSTVAFLTDQEARLEGQLKAAEDTLQTFREREQVVAPDVQAQADVQHLADLQAQRAQLAAERDALDSLLASIKESGGGSAAYRRLAAFPTFLENKGIQDLLQTLIGAQQQKTAMRTRRTEEYPDVVALTKQIDALQDQLGEIGKDYLGSLDQQIASLDGVLGKFGRQLEKVPAVEVQFARLKRRTDLLTNIDQLVQQRLQEARIQEAVEDPSVRVVESAVLPDRPIAPRPLRNLGLGGFLGLLLGVGLAFVREYSDRTLHPDDDVESLVGAPVLARVPPVAEAAKRKARRPEGLIAARDGRSLPAEAFRALRTNVRYTRAGEGTSEILVTSPGARDGKSLTASNLAVTMAQQGTRTLLVDADLRKSVQHLTFGVDPEPGLSECLVDGIPVRRAVRATNVEGLDLLPAGAPPPNPAELLGSDRMERLLAEARDAYQAIVIDTPPTLVVTDAAVLAPHLEGVIVVVRAEQTVTQAAEAAVEQLRRVGAEVLGVVFNDAEAQGKYGYYPDYYGDYFGNGKTGLRKLLPFG